MCWINAMLNSVRLCVCQAMEEMNGKELGGEEIEIVLAKPPDKKRKERQAARQTSRNTGWDFAHTQKREKTRKHVYSKLACNDLKSNSCGMIWEKVWSKQLLWVLSTLHKSLHWS